MLLRVALIDLDWNEADRFAELVRKSGTSTLLVAGESTDDPGLRVAGLCDVPRTIHLEDVAQGGFDVAWIGERSRRRAQVEALLGTLGIPIRSLEEMLAELNVTERGPSRVREPSRAPFEIDTALERAFPDLSGGATVRGRQGTSTPEAFELGAMPQRSDRAGISRLIARLACLSGASAAALWGGSRAKLRVMARSGPEDPLLRAMSELAATLDTAQVVSKPDGPHAGRLWGAWPIQASGDRVILAGAAIEPVDGAAVWECAALELERAWRSESLSGEEQ